MQAEVYARAAVDEVAGADPIADHGLVDPAHRQPARLEEPSAAIARPAPVAHFDGQGHGGQRVAQRLDAAARGGAVLEGPGELDEDRPESPRLDDRLQGVAVRVDLPPLGRVLAVGEAMKRLGGETEPRPASRSFHPRAAHVGLRYAVECAIDLDEAEVRCDEGESVEVARLRPGVENAGPVGV